MAGYLCRVCHKLLPTIQGRHAHETHVHWRSRRAPHAVDDSSSFKPHEDNPIGDSHGDSNIGDSHGNSDDSHEHFGFESESDIASDVSFGHLNDHEEEINNPCPWPMPPPKRVLHPHLTGSPCDPQGNTLPPGTPLLPWPAKENPTAPFSNIEDFKMAEFLFSKEQMSAAHIDKLLSILARRDLNVQNPTPIPFANAQDMYKMIDSIDQGDAPWDAFQVKYTGLVTSSSPSWKHKAYDVYCRNLDTVIKNMLQNRDFDGLVDYQPYKEFTSSRDRCYNEFMSGMHAWSQADIIYKDNPAAEGAMYLRLCLYIYKMMMPDMLHQMIKGCFKDHLVEWLEKYLKKIHGEKQQDEILDEIDKCLAAMPEFTGLRKFPDGHNFSQWTGSHSKALLKVFIPTLIGKVPDEIVRVFVTFADITYLVRRNNFDTNIIHQLEDTIQLFFTQVQVYKTPGIRTHFNLPRQHALRHYPQAIEDFGSPAGHDSAITEHRHISVVKEPWRRSNRNNALGQMLNTNQRLDKLRALRTELEAQGILPSTYTPPSPGFDFGDTSEGAVDDQAPPESERGYGKAHLAVTPQPGYDKNFEDLGHHSFVNCTSLSRYVQGYLFNLLTDRSVQGAGAQDMPTLSNSHVKVYHSASITFYAPSDESGIYGMRREYVRCTPNWWGRGPRRDCVLINEESEYPGFRKGMGVARLRLLFSFVHKDTLYPCAFVEWFEKDGDTPDPLTGMWRIVPDKQGTVRRLSVIHLDSIIRAAHLGPDYGTPRSFPTNFDCRISLDQFTAFYLNHYIDGHAFELLALIS